MKPILIKNLRDYNRKYQAEIDRHRNNRERLEAGFLAFQSTCTHPKQQLEVDAITKKPYHRCLRCWKEL